MSSFTNATPLLAFSGINDQSRGTNVRVVRTTGQFAPLLRIFAETGPTETTLVDTQSGSLTDIYGLKTLDRRGKFFNMQTLLAEALAAEGVPLFIKRLRPDDAGNPARITLAIDVVRDEIPKTNNQLAGFDYPEIVGDEIDVDPDAIEKVIGIRGRIVLLESNAAAVGTAAPTPGTMVSTIDAAQSTIYPLLELPASFFGEPGNMLGMRMWAPTSRDALPVDEEVAEQFNTRMYRFQFLRKASATASPTILQTVLGDISVDACFAPGAFSESSDLDYYAGDRLVQEYEDSGNASGQAPIYSPFEQIYVYTDNIATVQNMVYVEELTINPAAEDLTSNAGMVDIFTGIDYDGYRHHALYLNGALEGGIRLGQSTTVYASGGSDGTIDSSVYDELVTRENVSFGELGDSYQNRPLYPFTHIIDTGLGMEAKEAHNAVTSKRNDLIAWTTTFVEADGRAPTTSEEVSRAISLMAGMRANPESTLYGTPACRGVLVMQTGKWAQGGLRKPVPQIIDFAVSWAQMSGAANGRMTDGQNFDAYPNNEVNLISDINVDYFDLRVQNTLNRNGATYSLNKDMNTRYYPLLRSVYNDDTSVLLSPITVSICTDLIRLAYIVHAEHSGNASLSKEQLAQSCNNRLLELISGGRYNGRVTVIPETTFTKEDDLRGYSWHFKLTVQANNPRSVMIFDLETQRTDTVGV